MAGPRGIDLALDLARMPSLAHSIDKTPLPEDIFDVMRIAAGTPEVCQSASRATGQSVSTVIEAARFYLQQMVLRPDADPFHVLGLPPGASRELARRHLRCLLQWLHPDVNKDWDSIYTERVLKAWREVSARTGSASHSGARVRAANGSKAPANAGASVRMPWIAQSRKSMHLKPHVLTPVVKRIGIGVGAAALLLAGAFVVYATQSG